MAFDQSTRGRLQKLVNSCRSLLSDEFTIQLQQTYGLDPKIGEVTPIARLTHLDDRQRHTAEVLRQTLAHYLGADADNTDHRIAVLDRMVREQAFTVLNRLAALLMMEARGQLIESVSKGYQSRGYQLYSKIAGTALGGTGQAYQVYLFSVFDELAQELPALFDRYAANGLLFPRETTLRALLDELNHFEIEPLWAADETAGWIYQYFNSKEERKAMRDASQAPRNSRELAVRNQFFTPRYVVEFLVDNTLGRFWFNATGGQTDLRDHCQYLLIKPDEQLQAAVKLRDPRTLKLLDPACGSMHFGLYAFDLFAEIYREAWIWEQQHGPGSLDVSTQTQAALKPLRQTYDDEAAFARDVPRLIIEHNIYGVDIDPRAAQIATLALWLRAQRAWHDAGLKAKDRPLIGQGNVVAAIAPPAERELRQQFVANLDQRDAELFEKTLQLLKGLPELGVLLRVERELPHLIEKVYGKNTDLFNDQKKAKTWAQIESDLRTALTEFTQAAKSTYQGRLFAQDALQGLRLIDLCREVFDVVVMNPPFGLPASEAKVYLTDAFPETWKDIYAAFVERALAMMRPHGRLGAITPSMWQYTREMRSMRKMLYELGSPNILVELGGAVMDDAAVEAAVWTASKTNENKTLWSLDLLNIPKEDRANLMSPSNKLWLNHRVEDFFKVADAPYCHHMSKNLLRLWDKPKRLTSVARIAAGNTTFDDFRFLRMWPETVEKNFEKWRTYRSGGDFQPFYAPTKLRIFWDREGASVRASGTAKHGSDAQVMQSSDLWGKAGLGYPRIGTLGLGIRIAPEGEIFSSGSVFIYPDEKEDRLLLLGLLNSSLALRLFEAHGRHRKTETIALKDLPIVPSDLQPIRVDIEEEVAKAVKAVRDLESMDETNTIFSQPWPSFKIGSLQEHSKLAYKVVLDASVKITSLIVKHLNLETENMPAPDAINWNPIISPAEEARRLISYLVGVAFGRWSYTANQLSMTEDIHYDPFEPIPTVPLGMRKTSDKNNDDLKFEVIADDTNSSTGLGSIVSQLMSQIRGESTGDFESSICENLIVKDVNYYIQKPTGFFSDHLRAYSSNRRQAPIYWPLSTTSGNYTLWIYYPSLNNQTLFKAVNDFLDSPNGKLSQVSRECAELRIKGSSRSRDDEKHYETLKTLEQELTDMRDILLKIAPTYQPNQDDGVQITAAPLWPLFRHKPWQKVLKDTWTKLEKGDYDWAHLAMAYWPERVRGKCKTDKSIAIAHRLEELYVEPEAAPKKTRGKKKAGANE